MMTKRITKFDRLSLAIAMVQRGMRTGIIHHHTRLSYQHIRPIFREIHGTGPRSGQMKNPVHIVTTRQRVIEASILLSVYRRCSSVAMVEIDLPNLFKAHDLYREIRGEVGYPARDEIGINEAWVLARDLRSRDIYFHACKCCGVEYISVKLQKIRPFCPFCATENPPIKQQPQKHCAGSSRTAARDGARVEAPGHI